MKVSEPGLDRVVEAVERIEAGHDSLIAGRDAERRAAGEASSAEVLEQERRGREERRRDAERERNRWRWVRHFDRMAARHAALAADYERRAAELCEEAPTGGEA